MTSNEALQEFEKSAPRLLLLALSSIIALCLVSSIKHAVKWRSMYKQLHGPLKTLPFSAVFGSIPAYAAIAAKCPPDCHPMTIATLLYRKYGLGPMHFLDSWPIVGYRQMVISDPILAVQVQTGSLLKHSVLKEIIGHICGPSSMLYTEGAEWKRIRALFNPGFAMNHLITLVPIIVDDTIIFNKRLERAAESCKLLQMDKAAALLTIDIIGHVMLDHDLNSQTTDNKFVNAFQNTISWSPAGSLVEPFKNLNPIMPIMHWYNTRLMDQYLTKVIDDRYMQRGDHVIAETQRRRGKPAIDLALDEYVAEENQKGKIRSRGTDLAFKRFAIDQMKTFLFAGRDTTSGTISYIYYILSLHPISLAKVRQELDEIFGTDIAATPDLIKNDPLLVNKLVYTTAVIKEVLRLFPPASTARKGAPNTSITYEGDDYPTNGHMVWINVHTIHRREDLFPSPDEFIPERFLSGPDAWQEIAKDSWRPFEKGPRACLGQEFAMLEIKIIMALTLRGFDFSSAYEAYDRELGREKPGDMLDGKRGMFGYRSYQVLIATAKPVDGMPLWVKKRVTA